MAIFMRVYVLKIITPCNNTLISSKLVSHIVLHRDNINTENLYESFRCRDRCFL